jgi:hypothetical protein
LFGCYTAAVDAIVGAVAAAVAVVAFATAALLLYCCCVAAVAVLLLLWTTQLCEIQTFLHLCKFQKRKFAENKSKQVENVKASVEKGPKCRKTMGKVKVFHEARQLASLGPIWVQYGFYVASMWLLCGFYVASM